MGLLLGLGLLGAAFGIDAAKQAPLIGHCGVWITNGEPAHRRRVSGVMPLSTQSRMVCVSRTRRSL